MSTEKKPEPKRPPTSRVPSMSEISHEWLEELSQRADRVDRTLQRHGQEIDALADNAGVRIMWNKEREEGAPKEKKPCGCKGNVTETIDTFLFGVAFGALLVGGIVWAIKRLDAVSVRACLR